MIIARPARDYDVLIAGARCVCGGPWRPPPDIALDGQVGFDMVVFRLLLVVGLTAALAAVGLNAAGAVNDRRQLAAIERNLARVATDTSLSQPAAPGGGSYDIRASLQYHRARLLVAQASRWTLRNGLMQTALVGAVLALLGITAIRHQHRRLSSTA